MDPNRALDLAHMTDDELFDVLDLGDMSADERLDFLHRMSAWSHYARPTSAGWWQHAAVVAANWRSQLRWHVDQLIASALETEQQ